MSAFGPRRFRTTKEGQHDEESRLSALCIGVMTMRLCVAFRSQRRLPFPTVPGFKEVTCQTDHTCVGIRQASRGRLTACTGQLG
jgi:hypothetical protein